jgi:Flp pilus assembly CpaE family ATPase
VPCGADATAHLLDIEPRLRLLSGLPRADMWSQIRTGAFDAVLARLRAECEMVVVDCGFSLESAAPGHHGAGSGRNQTALHVLENSDAIVVVGRPDPVGLSRLVRAILEIRDLHPHVSTVIAINQMRGSVGWSERDIASTLLRLTGQQPDVFLPLDQAGVDLASLSGRSPQEMQPSSALARSFELLAGAALMAISSVVAHSG